MNAHTPMIVDASKLLRAPDITAYQTDGFVHLKGVLSKHEVQKLQRSVQAQIANLPTTRTGYDFESIAKQIWAGNDRIDTGGASRFEAEYYRAMIDLDEEARPIQGEVKPSENNDGMFFYDAGGWRIHKEIRDVALDSALPKLCADLLDTSYLNFWEDTTFVKTPNTVQKTTFHQDYAYFQIEGKKCCIVWIPLDVTTKETGTMQYIRGSHLWGKTYAPNVLIAQTAMLDAEDPKLPDIENNLSDYDIVTVDAEPGDVIIHDVMTVHGSGANLSKSENRRAMSFRYCGDDIRYFERPGAIPQPHIAKTLSDGDALFSKDYPLVWPRPYPEAKISGLFENMPVDKE